jgi:branched-chain amino acid transport system ATP-binding protein
MALLDIKGLNVDRAGLPIVRDASLVVEQGEITVLLGANGAGKTTLLDGVSGAAKVRAGSVLLDGADIAKARPARRARMGLAHVEQGRTVFAKLSTLDNLRVGLHPEEAIPEAFTLFPELEKRRDVAAGLLSGGEQQMLVIARALVAGPKVLLIDEMSLGLAPIIIQRLMRAVRELADRKGVGILLVEQFAHLALAVSDRAYVLSRGEMVYDGDGHALRKDQDLLRRLYLGDDAAPAAVA